MKIGCAIPNRDMRGDTPSKAIYDGLCRCGYDISLVSYKDGWPFGSKELDYIYLWNGRGRVRELIVNEARKRGVGTIIAEHGFFNRMSYTQIDLEGFNHTASWANDIHTIHGGEKRFFKAFGSKPAAQHGREDGYVLILGQVPTDAQLEDSEIHHIDVLGPLVRDALPSKTQIRVRQHPDIKASARSLEDDIRNARFCVTINSNAGNIAIAAGLPVLAFGPSLYGNYGVAKETCVATLGEDLELMLYGWHPNQGDAVHYLQALAARQWNKAELREGSVLKRILE